MQRRTRLIACAALGAVTSVASALPAKPGRVGDPRRIHAVTKLLLAPTLQAGLLTRREHAGSTLVPLLVATSGSLVGDWYMMRETDATTHQESRRLLRLGAACFAVQQGVMIRLLVGRGDRPRLRHVVPVAAVVGGLARLDAVTADRREPTPADPVLLTYGALLGAMAALASDDDDPQVVWGGRVFLLSDALIVIRQCLLTGRPAAIAQLGVMATYAAALALLVEGLSDDRRR